MILFWRVDVNIITVLTLVTAFNCSCVGLLPFYLDFKGQLCRTVFQAEEVHAKDSPLHRCGYSIFYPLHLHHYYPGNNIMVSSR